jgi:hypothetical protein
MEIAEVLPLKRTGAKAWETSTVALTGKTEGLVVGKRTPKVTAATPRNRNLPRGDSGSSLQCSRSPCTKTCREPRGRPAECRWMALTGSGSTNPAMTLFDQAGHAIVGTGERTGWVVANQSTTGVVFHPRGELPSKYYILTAGLLRIGRRHFKQC